MLTLINFLFYIVFFLLILTQDCIAATEFVVRIDDSGGDYSSLSAAETGLENDLTAANIKVFSISAYSSPTIVAGDTVLGQTSGATGVCVLVNIARTQILIKTIAVASFQSGEVVQKTGDAGVTVTLSNAGDSPIIVLSCYPMVDTTPVVISGTWVVSATNYIKIWTDPSLGNRHSGVWNDALYRLEVTNASGIDNGVGAIRFEGLQIKITNNTDGKGAIRTNNITSIDIQATDNILKAVDTGSAVTSGIFEYGNSSGTGRYWNNIIYNFSGVNGSRGISLHRSSGSVYAYNNTIYGCYYGIRVSNAFNVKNNISYNNTTDYYGTFGASSTHNLSKDSTAPLGVSADSGTCDGDIENHLVDSDQNFLSTIKVGMRVKNTTDTTYAIVTAVNSNSDLTLSSDIFPVGTENYTIYQAFVGTLSFVNTGAGTENLHLVEGDVSAINYGTDLSADIYLSFSLDIDEDARPALNWDIGADEFMTSNSFWFPTIYF